MDLLSKKMKFYMPVKVYEGRDCVREHAPEIAACGKHPLIVTGKRSAFANGSFEDLTSVLKAENIDYLVFSDIEENPSTDTVFDAKEKFSSENIDLVIGIGGGSALDAAKAIALVLRHPEADLSYLYDAAEDPSALPLICIPTTCGTGSEVTGVSVLTRHDKKTKISMVHKVFPKLSFIDGKYLESASMDLIVNTSMDALSHLLESVLNAKADAYVKMIAKEGLRAWAETKDVLSGERQARKEDFQMLMHSSALAGMAIAQSGTSLPHALSYVLTYDLGIPHGRAVGYFLPGFIDEAPAEERDELIRLSGFKDPAGFKDFTVKLFGKAEIPEAELIRTYETVRSNEAKMRSASFEVDDEALHRIVFGR